MRQWISRLSNGALAALIAVVLLAPVNVLAVVKNIQVMSNGQPVANTKITLTSPSGRVEEEDTDDKGVLIFDFDQDGDWKLNWDGGSMVVKVGGGIGPWIVVPAIAGVTAAIINAADSDNDDKSSGSSSPGSGPISGVYSMTTSVTSNPDSHPNLFDTCSYNVTESSGSLTIDCSGPSISFTASGSVDGSNNFTASGSGTYAGFPTTFNVSGTFVPTAAEWSGNIDGCNGGCPDTNGNTIEEPIEATFTGTKG